ncbi:PINc domain-containing protein [Mycena venus]|uniref:PINc domain-containing protein n=1 Tax=Mycena venus TaxID=2733690 RepID=A0A8H6XVR0_9AGAR|nr:PINc domain-containing protein [Mycena venus]
MPSRIVIYQAVILCLKEACSTGIQGRSFSEVAQVQVLLERYLLSMAADNVVSGIVESLESRKMLLELASSLGLAHDRKLRTAWRTDGERIATFLLFIFTSKSAEEAVLRLEGDPAQCFLDVVQNTLDKGFLTTPEQSRMARRIIRKLSTSCDRLPSSLFITGVTGREERPTFGGGYGDIYRASYNHRIVAVKYMRAVQYMRGSDLRCIRLKFCREALVWKELRHPHILPFLGIDEDTFPSPLCMVSPWMEHGTVLKYLEEYGHASVDKLLCEIAQGLQYLHSRDIVHGDLRGANILINEDWSACLADFGLSIFSDATSSMTTNRGGSPYWMAPELLNPDQFGLKFTRTPASDVYAFGCVCLELYTGRPPFSGQPEPAALIKVISGDRPERPSSSPAMSDILWQHVSAYWTHEPSARPVTQVVVQNMVWLAQSPPPPTSPSASDRSLSSTVYWTAHGSSIFSSTDGSSASSALSDTKSNPGGHDPSTNIFAIQLKKLYRAIMDLEAKIKQQEISAENEDANLVPLKAKDQDSEVESDKECEKWKRQIEDHKELAEIIHNLLEISLAPSVPASLRNIPIKYNIVIRLWTFAFHTLLESLRRASFTSVLALEHLQDFIYYAYTFYTGLLEEPTLNPFKSCWLEALGDLARYKMAVAAMVVSGAESENALTADNVYAAGTSADPTKPAADLLPPPAAPAPKSVSDAPAARIDDSPPPGIGFVAAQLLDVRPERELWRCIARDWYHVAIADEPTHGKMHHHLGLLCQEVEREELRGVYHFYKSMTVLHPFFTSRESVLPLWSVTAQVRRALPEANAIDLFLLLHGMLFTNIRLTEFEPTLERFIERLEIDGAEEREWIMMAVVNICAVLEYGNPDGALKKVGSVDMDEDKIGIHLGEPPGSNTAETPASFCFALRLMFAMLGLALRCGGANPYLTVALTFLATVLKHPQILDAIKRAVPWDDLAAFFARIPTHLMASQGLAEVRTNGEERWATLGTGCVPLPEDWCLRGMVWMGSKVYPRRFWKTGLENRSSEIAILEEEHDEGGEGADVGDDELERRWVRILRCAVDIADVVDGFTWIEGTQQWRMEGALATKVEAWREQDLQAEEDERRRTGKSWADPGS